VPLKPLDDALGRLGGLLDAGGRRVLQEAMLRDVLGACGAAERVARTAVVTDDARGAALARAEGATVIADHRPPRGMDAAVRRGMAAARRAGARSALVLFADLPLAGADDLDAVVVAGGPAPGVVLVPSRDGEGTNALLVTPPEALAPELGPGSLARHLRQAERRDLAVRLAARSGLGLDVDTPEDLAAFWGLGRAGATRAACVELDVARRLAAAGAAGRR
jgi:2-phospho-L-lactate/phosphoenolpyruvate guanylyltransferase